MALAVASTRVDGVGLRTCRRTKKEAILADRLGLASIACENY
jgi:hypothetical protein